MINFKITIITATRNRSNILQTKAIPSLLQQTDQDFEWVIVNDGADPKTRQVVQKLQANFHIVYQEIEHLQHGFGLAHGRNCGLKAATGDIVCYLDDDNSLASDYVGKTKAFFRSNPQASFSMVQQSRHRDVYKNRQLIRQGKTFVSPNADCTVEDLILHRQLFDSNGFAHIRSGAPRWNPDYQIFIDYEYFLRCLGCWGCEGFALVPEVLVDYVQSSEGIIGRSKYVEWADEIESLTEALRERLCASGQYPILDSRSIMELSNLARSWRERQGQGISAFVTNGENTCS